MKFCWLVAKIRLMSVYGASPAAKWTSVKRWKRLRYARLYEETGVRAHAGQVLTALNAYDKDEAGRILQHFVLLAVLCVWQSGEPVAADDAEDAGWFRLQALQDGTLELSQDVIGSA